ncbi:MAG: preprotein translocase subunit SecA, partial [Candidatus Gracilibacteria bacterium]|nr:preprotein translocase subunit SecA [Candidatus Gracilibacteria bacterium]
YSKDIVYATNNELGFDYLRDNMVIKSEDKAQSKLFFAIIDEVDSILIDEARTPLIISMPESEATSKYMKFAAIAKTLKAGEHYKIDEKQKTATLTEKGIEKIEEVLKVDNIYISNHYNDLHHIENAIKATGVYIRDKDYLVNDGEVLIIDEHTGRVLGGRRYSDGLHQAIEAKEGVEIKQESKTLASITFQNYFRMYWKLSGMTGTAKTEEEEFYKVYGLETLVIPTNKPIARVDNADLLFKNEKGKFEYVVKLIKEIHETGQPILVGTVSVDKSEYLSARLKEIGIPHNVLNAKQHEKEAEVVATAGQKGAVTIATNMAGRGTDIKLGEGVRELGGLCIIGTEKHETRRIDNQLRGRAGRQGDPGSTQFLISPNDDIMRIFGGDKLFSAFNSPIFASLPDNEPLAQSGMLTRRITSVQKQVEGHNFDIRKHVLQYDDVINKHREIIYSRRNKILNSENIDEDVITMIKNQISSLVISSTSSAGDSINKKGLIAKVNEFLGVEAIDDKIENDDILGTNDTETLTNYIFDIAIEELDKIKGKAISIEAFYDLERRIVLASIDELWMRHIDAMSKLRESVAFEGYAQRDPLVVYKEKAYEKFKELLNELEYKVVKAIYGVDKNTQVEQVNIDVDKLDVNEKEIEDIINNLSPEKQKQTPANSNPLFVKPGADKPSKVEVKKNKIRV